MKRFAIFALLGPLLGALTVMLIVIPYAQWRDGIGVRFDLGHLRLLLIAVPVGYILGVIPALSVAALDWFLKDVAGRIAYAALAGAVASLLVPLFIQMGTAGPFIMGLGLVGAIPAAVCSWLSGSKRASSANVIPSA